MKLQELLGATISVWLALGLFFGSQITAQEEKFLIGVSNSVKMMFPRVLESLQEVSKIPSGQYKLYGGEVNISSILSGSFPVDKYQIAIVTNSELPAGQESSFSVKNGRKFDGEFLIASLEKKAASVFLNAKLVYPDEQSFKDFWNNALHNCLYESVPNPPTKIIHRPGLPPEDFDMVVLKLLDGYEHIVNFELLYTMQSERGRRGFPILFYDSSWDRNTQQRFVSCLGGGYRFEEKKVEQERARPTMRRLYGDQPQQPGGASTVQTVHVSEQIRLVTPAGHADKMNDFLNDALPKPLVELKAKFKANPKDSFLREKLENYAKTYRLLTDGSQGILEEANIKYEYAEHWWQQLEKGTPVGKIQQKLTDKKTLDEGELHFIQESLSAFEAYFKSREELKDGPIDFTLLAARKRVTRLRFFLHQHYLNKGDRQSTTELQQAQHMLELLGKEITTVKKDNAFDYENLRHAENFMELDDYYQKRLQDIAKIPRSP